MKTQKLSQYFQVIHPEYVYLKIIPDISIRNYNSSVIAKSIHHMGRAINSRISFEEKKFIYKSPFKAMYIIDIHKTNVDFILVVPRQYTNLAREKIREVWAKVKIVEIEGIDPFSQLSKKYCISYKKEDALSLDIDKKNNDPLNQILNVIEIMDDTDRITLIYNFMPVISQYSWESEYQNTISKLEQGFTVNKNTTLLTVLSKIGFLINYIIDTFLTSFQEFFGKDDYTGDILTNVRNMLGLVNNKNNVSTATRKKRNDIIIETQLLLVSGGNNSEINANTTAQTFKNIEDDNSLQYKPIKKIKDINKYNLGITTNKMSIAECQNLIQVPGHALLSEFKNIEKIDTNESPVPNEISTGIIRAGMNEFRGKKTEVYHTEDTELKNTGVCICGGNRSGKTTLIANNVFDMIKDGRTVIVPDFCGKCQLSNELTKVIPKEKILNIDCSDFKAIQGFGYNEIVPKDNSIFELYSCAKMKSAKLKELINLINESSVELEGRMERYLEFAALIVFVSNGSVNDVFRVLKDHKLRHQYVDKIPSELKENMEEYVEELLEIDEITKGTVTGTKQGHVTAILSRIHRLKSNSYIEEMLKKECTNNINLIDEMQKGKLILLRMYDNMFSTQLEKDIYVCYWLTKIWGALQKRFCDIDGNKLIQTVMVIDELYQTKNAEKYLTMILSQMPKYKTKLILSCHHLAQIPVIQEELKSALCTYIFIQSSNKKNYYAMKEEFEDKGFCLDDLLHLKRFQALCLITYEEGYWAGIVQLPKPI